MGEVWERGTPEGGYDRDARVRRRLGSPRAVGSQGRSVCPGVPRGPSWPVQRLQPHPALRGPLPPCVCPLCPERGHSCWEAPQGVSSCKSLQPGPLCLRVRG